MSYFNTMIWIGTVTFLTTACLEEAGENSVGNTQYVYPATSGGNGGFGGEIGIYYMELSDTTDLNEQTHVDGGLPGGGGVGELHGNQVDGAAGPEGTHQFYDVSQGQGLSEYSFDATGIEADDVLSVVGQTAYIAGFDGGLPWQLELDELYVGHDARLYIDCHARIRARLLVIEQGATLLFRERDGRDCTIGIGEGVTDGSPGLNGGVAFIEADIVEVAGTIDLNGNLGEAGEDGGDGGLVTIQTRLLDIREGGTITASGGDAGSGEDERIAE